jgi:hypothetical protein
MDTGEEPEESLPKSPLKCDPAATVPGGYLCIAPWYSMLAHGFVSRLYLLDDRGWVMRYVEGAALPTYEEAHAASRLLQLDAERPTSA